MNQIKIKDGDHGKIRRYISKVRLNFLKENRNNMLKYCKIYDHEMYIKLKSQINEINKNYTKRKNGKN